MTRQQKLFNLFMEQNYQQLLRQLPRRDMLHAAYVTVYHIRRRVVPTNDNFRRLMEEAYNKKVSREVNHAMHFIPPDSVFWILQDENPDDEDLDDRIDARRNKDTAELSLADLSDGDINRIVSFLRKRYNQSDITVFNLAIKKRFTVAQIAEVTCRNRKDISQLLDKMGNDIRNNYRPINKR